MEDLYGIQTRRQEVQENIEKAFGSGVNLNNELEKARSGVYANNSENRKLFRVGQKYGDKIDNVKKDDFIDFIMKIGEYSSREEAEKDVDEFVKRKSKEDIERFKHKLKKAIETEDFGFIENEFQKARVSVYADNAKNRRLNRVGQAYGHKKQEEMPKGKVSTKKEEGGDSNKNRAYDVSHIMWAMGESSKMSAAVESLANVDFSDMDEKEIKSVVEKLPAKKLDELYDKHIEGKSGKSDVSSHASKASDGALKRAAADENASEDVRNAAKEELKKRGGDNGNNTDYIKKIGNKEFVEGLKNDKEALKTLDRGSDEYKQTKKRIKEAKERMKEYINEVFDAELEFNDNDSPDWRDALWRTYGGFKDVISQKKFLELAGPQMDGEQRSHAKMFFNLKNAGKTDKEAETYISAYKGALDRLFHKENKDLRQARYLANDAAKDAAGISDFFTRYDE